MAGVVQGDVGDHAHSGKVRLSAHDDPGNQARRVEGFLRPKGLEGRFDHREQGQSGDAEETARSAVARRRSSDWRSTPGIDATASTRPSPSMGRLDKMKSSGVRPSPRIRRREKSSRRMHDACGWREIVQKHPMVTA